MYNNLLNSERVDKKILLICDNIDNVPKIKYRLTKDVPIPWNMTHFVNMPDSIPFIHKTDIVILDLALEGIVTPKEIFRTIQDQSQDISIIVLKKKEKHNVCVYMVEKLGGGTIVKSSFEKLAEAIDFSLAKPHISKNLTVEINNKQRSILSAHDIEKIKVKRISDEKTQYISWMNGGGYSVETNIGKDVRSI